MATFTIELAELIEQAEKIGIDRWKACGLDEYPIFDESHRDVLNTKIVDHYYKREIGQESVQMFRLAMSRKMNEIMVFYNQLYVSETILFDPMLTINIETKGRSNDEGTNSGTSQTTTGAESDSTATSSDYPQTQLSGVEHYATSSTKSVGNSETTAASEESSTNTNIRENESATRGMQGLPSALLNDYRETFLNIDLSIITELEELFMSIWNISEDYTWHGGNYDCS